MDLPSWPQTVVQPSFSSRCTAKSSWANTLSLSSETPEKASISGQCLSTFGDSFWLAIVERRKHSKFSLRTCYEWRRRRSNLPRLLWMLRPVPDPARILRAFLWEQRWRGRYLPLGLLWGFRLGGAVGERGLRRDAKRASTEPTNLVDSSILLHPGL